MDPKLVAQQEIFDELGHRDIICCLSKKACQVLFFELYHHTCYRDNIPEFKEIMKVIREVANGKEG